MHLFSFNDGKHQADVIEGNIRRAEVLDGCDAFAGTYLAHNRENGLLVVGGYKVVESHLA